MTSLLAVPDPDTATPGEFADAAVAAGLDEADVTELTRLFEDVRYGERDAAAEPIGDSGAADSDGTATREERAVSVFRAIEAAYPGADSRDDPSASGQRSNSER